MDRVARPVESVRPYHRERRDAKLLSDEESVQLLVAASRSIATTSRNPSSIDGVEPRALGGVMAGHPEVFPAGTVVAARNVTEVVSADQKRRDEDRWMGIRHRLAVTRSGDVVRITEVPPTDVTAGAVEVSGVERAEVGHWSAMHFGHVDEDMSTRT